MNNHVLTAAMLTPTHRAGVNCGENIFLGNGNSTYYLRSPGKKNLNLIL